MEKSSSQKTHGPLRMWGPVVASVMVISAGAILDVFYDYGLVRSLEPYRMISEAVSALGLGWTQVLVIITMFFYSRKIELPREPRVKLRGASISATAAYLLSGIGSQALKHLIGRARPYVEDPWLFKPLEFSNKYASLPSGHTATSFALAFVLGAFFPRWRWVFYGLAALVGISRITLGRHYPLDVAAGAMLGLLSGWLAVRWYRKRNRSS